MCDTGKPTKASGWRRQDKQEHKEKITAAATVNPNDWQLAPLTDEALEYRRSGLVISREQGLRYDAGFAVPVLMS